VTPRSYPTPGKRCASEQRLGAEIDRAKAEGRPIVIVAHSLGAVVAYDYLSARRDSLPIVDPVRDDGIDGRISGAPPIAHRRRAARTTR
jgi:alpha-beta hydrolase superfamily lysophospholipase